LPHQCLKCGELFNEGSTIILRGCPECRGTRFFYTQTPLTMTEREKLLATSEITLREAIDKLVQKAKDGEPITAEDGAKWSISGPQPTKVVADPALVPNDLPSAIPTISVVADEKKLIVKIPPAPKIRRRKKDSVRWDYNEPEPVAPVSDRMPLFSDVGLRVPPAFQTEPAAAPAPAPEPAPLPPVPAAPKVTTPNPTLEAFMRRPRLPPHRSRRRRPSRSASPRPTRRSRRRRRSPKRSGSQSRANTRST
jgi:predicted  nucleic acid-binding Zn-ribbon protein